MEEILIKVEKLKKWTGLGIIVTTNNSDSELAELINDLHSKVKNLDLHNVSISLERAKKYARHQHFLGTQGSELVEFEDWAQD